MSSKEAGAPAGTARAVRTAGAATLALQGFAILLAFPVVRLLGGGLTAFRIAVLVGLPVLLFLSAGLLRSRVSRVSRFGWWSGTALQAAAIATGVFSPALSVLGLVFAAIWGYVLYLRRTLMRK